MLVAVGLVSLLCDFATENELELEKTEGMVETVGEFETGRRGTVRFRVFRHPEQARNAKTRLSLIRAVSRIERYMATAFPAKTVVLNFDDTELPENYLGQTRILRGASILAPISHSLSAQWIQIDIRPDQEEDTDYLRSVLAHEVAHYYWHHQPAVYGREAFFLDEGAAHYLEYKIGGNEEIRTSAQLARICRRTDPQTGPNESQLKAIATALDIGLSAAEKRQLATNREFAKAVSLLCSDDELLGRFGAAGVLIEAEKIMGPTGFQRAFREIWEASRDYAQDASDVRDALCDQATTRKCERITAAFKNYGYDP